MLANKKTYLTIVAMFLTTGAGAIHLLGLTPALSTFVVGLLGLLAIYFRSLAGEE